MTMTTPHRRDATYSACQSQCLSVNESSGAACVLVAQDVSCSLLVVRMLQFGGKHGMQNGNHGMHACVHASTHPTLRIRVYTSPCPHIYSSGMADVLQ